MLSLSKFKDLSLKEYLKNEDTQAVVERRLQLCCQIAIDIANYLITRLRLQMPDEEENVFIILAKGDMIDESLGLKMKGIVRFRNILVHNYFEINHQIVYKNFKRNLQDFKEFARQIVGFLEKK